MGIVAIRDIAKTLVMSPIGTNVDGVSPERDGVNREHNEQDHTG